MFLVIGQLICVFSLFAQENVKVASIFQINTDSVKNCQEFVVGGPNCPGCKGLLPYRTNPLILIDGVEVSSDVLAHLKPEEIKDFSVIKDASAIERYGIRGTNGVIVITSNLSKKDLTDCFTPEEIKDLAKLLDFFNEYICVSEGIDKKEIIKCYDSFIQRMIETAEAGSLDAQIPFTQQKEIYNQISDSLFNHIWGFGKSRIKLDSPDTLKYITYRIDGKYMEFLNKLGKEYEFVKNYSEDFELAGDISPSMIADILMIKETYQYDLNDVRLQLVIAIHYLTMNDKHKRKERY